MRALTDHEAKVCFKLYRRGCFGAGHKLIDTVASGFPSQESGDVKAAITQLIVDNILIEHPTAHGKAVHINPDRKNDIYADLSKRKEYAWLKR